MLILMKVHGTLIAVLLQITGSELQSCLVLSMNCYFSFGGMFLEKEQQQLSSLMLLVPRMFGRAFSVVGSSSRASNSPTHRLSVFLFIRTITH